jgi:hypothetical protein
MVLIQFLPIWCHNVLSLTAKGNAVGSYLVIALFSTLMTTFSQLENSCNIGVV